MKIASLAFVAVLLAGCSIVPATPQDEAEAATPLTCSGQAQCDRYWHRAYEWIDKHSSTKIDLANDQVIRSRLAPENSVYRMAYAKKVKDGDGHRIDFISGCANPIGCQEASATFFAEFKRYVEAN